MKRTDVVDHTEQKRLDGVNEERLETSRKRIVHALEILKDVKWEIERENNTKDEKKLITNISHAVNLLEVAETEMNWHCEWFSYDNGICIQIDNAVEILGDALVGFSEVTGVDYLGVSANVTDARVVLTKVLATLFRWNDETADVSEI